MDSLLLRASVQARGCSAEKEHCREGPGCPGRQQVGHEPGVTSTHRLTAPAEKQQPLVFFHLLKTEDQFLGFFVYYGKDLSAISYGGSPDPNLFLEGQPLPLLPLHNLGHLRLTLFPVIITSHTHFEPC